MPCGMRVSNEILQYIIMQLLGLQPISQDTPDNIVETATLAILYPGQCLCTGEVCMALALGK